MGRQSPARRPLMCLSLSRHVTYAATTANSFSERSEGAHHLSAWSGPSPLDVGGCLGSLLSSLPQVAPPGRLRARRGQRAVRPTPAFEVGCDLGGGCGGRRRARHFLAPPVNAAPSSGLPPRRPVGSGSDTYTARGRGTQASSSPSLSERRCSRSRSRPCAFRKE